MKTTDVLRLAGACVMGFMHGLLLIPVLPVAGAWVYIRDARTAMRRGAAGDGGMFQFTAEDQDCMREAER